MQTNLLIGGEWRGGSDGDVITVLDETVVRRIIPRLKEAGARGIVEYSLNKVIE